MAHLPANVRALLLDAGGTLVLADLDAVAAVLAEAGHTVTRDQLRAALIPANRAYAAALADGGQHLSAWDTLARRWLEGVSLSRAMLDEGVERVRTAHQLHGLWRCVPDGVPEAIAAARAAGMPVGVVSNAEGQLQQLLDDVGLGDAFDAVLDSTVEGVRKPDPEIFLRACQRLAVEPPEALYAGDIPEVDIRGAQAAGLAAALIDPYDAHPDYAAAPRFECVTDLIGALLAGRSDVRAE